MIDILVNDFLAASPHQPLDKIMKTFEKRKKELSNLFSEEKIDLTTVEDFRKVFSNLIIGGKDETYDAVVSKYGFESLREHLKYFLYGADPLEERFNLLTDRVPEVSQLTWMEVATFAQPRKFCIWDRSAKETVKFIGHSRMHGLSESAFNETITGLDYVWAKLALNHVREILSTYSFRKFDFVDVFLFTRYVDEKWIRKSGGGWLEKLASVE